MEYLGEFLSPKNNTHLTNLNEKKMELKEIQIYIRLFDFAGGGFSIDAEGVVVVCVVGHGGAIRVVGYGVGTRSHCRLRYRGPPHSCKRQRGKGLTLIEI